MKNLATALHQFLPETEPRVVEFPPGPLPRRAVVANVFYSPDVNEQTAAILYPTGPRWRGIVAAFDSGTATIRSLNEYNEYVDHDLYAPRWAVGLILAILEDGVLPAILEAVGAESMDDLPPRVRLTYGTTLMFANRVRQIYTS